MLNGKLQKTLKQFWIGYGPTYFREAKKFRSQTSCLAGAKVGVLRENGVVRLPNFPPELVALMSDHSALLESGLVIKDENSPLPGVSNRILVSLKSQLLQSYLSDVVSPYFEGYRGKTFVVRGNPRVVYNEFSDRLPADKFHLDYGFHQLTLQVLLNDVDEDMVHMEYLEGSNSSSWFSPSASLFLSRKPDKFMTGCKRVKLTGSAGTAYLFDAGNGYHRANNDSISKVGRKVFSINFVAGTHIGLPIDHYEDLREHLSLDLENPSIFSTFIRG